MTTKPKLKTSVLSPAVQPALLPALSRDPREVAAVIRQNLGPTQLTPFDLDRVRVPAGGGLTWQVPSLEGEPESVSSLEGVVVSTRFIRSYWPGEYEGGNDPPQCSSQDGQRGMGDPGGNCASCAFAQFGSAPKGSGQACKSSELIFLPRADSASMLPLLLVLPPTSLREMRKFTLRLSGKNIALASIVTAFKLRQVKNATGITYSQAYPALVTTLSAEQWTAMKSYRGNIVPSLSALRAEEVMDNGEPGGE